MLSIIYYNVNTQLFTNLLLLYFRMHVDREYHKEFQDLAEKGKQ
jgi:hypothetical protein